MRQNLLVDTDRITQTVRFASGVDNDSVILMLLTLGRAIMVCRARTSVLPPSVLPPPCVKMLWMTVAPNNSAAKVARVCRAEGERELCRRRDI